MMTDLQTPHVDREAPASQAGYTQQAWRALLDLLRDADQTWLAGDRAVHSELDAAEGYCHLANLLSYAFDFFVESDPARPEFVPIALPSKKILGDNTDSVYFYTNIRGDVAYRIRGRRADDVYLSFIVHGGPSYTEHHTQRTISNLNMRQIVTEADGSFEIILSPERPADAVNWLKLEDDARCVITREYYLDRWHDDHATFGIERVEAAEPPAPLTDEDMARRLRDVASFLTATMAMVPMRAQPVNEYAAPFRFTVNHPSWGTPDNIYARCFFSLEPDEALVIEGTMTPCVYWGIQLWNPFMQSLDYRSHQCSVNQRTARIKSGDSFLVVVAGEDPGVPNWLDTAGHRDGAVFVRWLCAEGEPPTPTTRVVKIADLRAGRV
jgi:hypothetical protein